MYGQAITNDLSESEWNRSERKKKDEFEWMVVESERPKNVVPFQKRNQCLWKNTERSGVIH